MYIVLIDKMKILGVPRVDDFQISYIIDGDRDSKIKFVCLKFIEDFIDYFDLCDIEFTRASDQLGRLILTNRWVLTKYMK